MYTVLFTIKSFIIVTSFFTNSSVLQQFPKKCLTLSFWVLSYSNYQVSPPNGHHGPLSNVWKCSVCLHFSLGAEMIENHLSRKEIYPESFYQLFSAIVSGCTCESPYIDITLTFKPFCICVSTMLWQRFGYNWRIIGLILIMEVTIFACECRVCGQVWRGDSPYTLPCRATVAPGVCNIPYNTLKEHLFILHDSICRHILFCLLISGGGVLSVKVPTNPLSTFYKQEKKLFRTYKDT